MSGPPRFTVVIPAFNSAPFIAATLNSLATQTYRSFDVVVVDDRSTDDTVNVASASLATNGLVGEVVVRGADANKGVSTCRNIGIDAARGEWIAFLDSDDLFAPQKLQRMSETIDAWGDTASAVYHPSTRFEDGSGRPLGTTTTGTPGAPRSILDQLLLGNLLATCGLVVRKSLLREIGGFDSTLHGVEDYWLGIQLAARSPFVFVDEPLAHIRVRSGSLMGNRHLSHYALQHASLLRVARHSAVLSPAQRRVMRDHLWSGPTRWHMSYRIPQGGWREVLAGAYVFLRNGCPGFALRLVFAHLRQTVLGGIASVARRLRGSRDARASTP